MEVEDEPWYGHHDGGVGLTDSVCKNCTYFTGYNCGGFGMVDSLKCEYYGGWVLPQADCVLRKVCE